MDRRSHHHLDLAIGHLHQLTGFPFQDDVYAQLKKRILSGKLEKGQRLSYDVVAKDYNITRWAAQRVISKLKKDGLIISKGKAGSIVL